MNTIEVIVDFEQCGECDHAHTVNDAFIVARAAINVPEGSRRVKWEGIQTRQNPPTFRVRLTHT